VSNARAGTTETANPPLEIAFADGSLVICGLEALGADVPPWCVPDPRVGAHRAPAHRYADLVRRCHRRVPYRDRARDYRELALGERDPLPLRGYQRRALESWEGARRRGVVVLPTGAGKTYVAAKAILACQRSTLIVAPTIDLVVQWAGELERRFGCEVGRYGGGDKDLRDLTVATYDSAVLIAPHYGNRFGLLVCDECHHLPSAVFATLAESCIAPFRLGLSATPERSDGMHLRLQELLGPEVWRSDIHELEGRFLADYQVEVVEVAMDPDERTAYEEERAIYLGFVRSHGIRFDSPDGWQRFIAEAARDPEGRRVLRAWREQKRLSRASRAKLRALWQILRRHPGDRCLVFTDDNATAYAIGREMILPVLTHHTKTRERKAMLEAFREGRYPVLVTSKVLNEGVDVPDAAVGVVVSGSGSVREHVQRLGRILRPRTGKVARLYEVISMGTAEQFTSQRRREHIAFGDEEDEPC